MPGTSSRSLIEAWALTLACSPADRPQLDTAKTLAASLRRIAFLSIAAVCCVTSIGCRTTPHPGSVRTVLPLSEAARKDLVTAEERFEHCTSAFFDDDWDAVVQLSEQLQEISVHWQAEAKKLPADDPFTRHTQKFAQAARTLHAAAPEKNVGKTTSALRDMSRHLAALKRLENETEQTETPEEPKDVPEPAEKKAGP